VFNPAAVGSKEGVRVLQQIVPYQRALVKVVVSAVVGGDGDGGGGGAGARLWTLTTENVRRLKLTLAMSGGGGGGGGDGGVGNSSGEHPPVGPTGLDWTELDTIVVDGAAIAVADIAAAGDEVRASGSFARFLVARAPRFCFRCHGVALSLSRVEGSILVDFGARLYAKFKIAPSSF
jgi:hypothetical protein